jgi:hypothetical protein
LAVQGKGQLVTIFNFDALVVAGFLMIVAGLVLWLIQDIRESGRI